jgi:hypothetical protein
MFTINRMECRRCHSSRIQRDFEDAMVPLRLVRVQKLLCNNCGLSFLAFDPLGEFSRTGQDEINKVNRRRGPRFYAHLPASISLVEKNEETGKASYSESSRGHCEAISEFGMALSLVGTRVPAEELSKPGRLLFVRIDLPEAAIESVVSIITHDRIGEERNKRWYLGVGVYQISEENAARLAAYIKARAESVPII